MINGINRNTFFARKQRKVDPVEKLDYYYEDSDQEGLIIEVEYEDLTDNESNKSDNILVKEELTLYNSKGKVVNYTNKKHSLLEKVV